MYVCIQAVNTEFYTDTVNFIPILKNDYSISVNKLAIENLHMHKREKSISLPKATDIMKMLITCKEQRNILGKKIEYGNFAP